MDVFHRIFGLPESERLVNCIPSQMIQSVILISVVFSCFQKGGITPGWLYLSEHYFGFHATLLGSETKILVELKDVIEIRKEKSKAGLISDSLCVKVANGKEYNFTSILRRDEVFGILQKLVNNAAQKVLSGNIVDQDKPGMASSSADSPSELPVDVGENLKEQIEMDQLNDFYRKIFRLPSDEIIVDRTMSMFWMDVKSEEIWRGDLFLSNNFIGFFYLKKGDGVQWILPACCIKKMEKVYPEGESSIYDPFAISLTTLNGHKLMISVGASLSQCNRFCNKLKTILESTASHSRQLQSFISRLPSSNLHCETDESLIIESGFGCIHGFPGFEEHRENMLLDYWSGYFKEFGRNLAIVKTPLFGRLIRIGLPHKIRGEIWEVCCGSIFDRFKSPNLHTELLAKNAGLNSCSIEEIEKDLERSLPEYPAYKTSEGIASLRRVLQSYAWYNPSLGYCQAMNIVTSAMLIYASEAQTFWLLKHLCQDALPGYYSTTMYGVVIDQVVFEELASQNLPLVWDHFQKNQISLSLASTPWFLTIFINTMPLHLAFRVLDWFFLDGPKVLFQIALAVLKINQAELLQVIDDGEMMILFKNYFDALDELIAPDEPGKKPFSNFHHLILTAYHDYRLTITTQLIQELRQKHHLKVVRNMGEFSKKTIVRDVASRLRFFKESTLSYFYDEVQKALYYSESPSNGLKLPEFLVVMQHLFIWAEEGPNEADNAPLSVSVLLEALFNFMDSEKKGKLKFIELATGLETFAYTMKVEERVDLFFEAFMNSEDLIDYDRIIQVSEVFLYIFRHALGEAHLSAVSELIKAFSRIETNGIDCDQFRSLIMSNSFFEEFFVSGWPESIRIKPPIELELVDIADKGGKGILAQIWGILANNSIEGVTSVGKDGRNSPKSPIYDRRTFRLPSTSSISRPGTAPGTSSTPKEASISNRSASVISTSHLTERVDLLNQELNSLALLNDEEES